jgi:methylase of polypeptide subunit release factors
MKTPSPEEKSRTRTCNIFMVDNEPDISITIKMTLEENGDNRVDTFNESESALSAFEPGRYDLAILGPPYLTLITFMNCYILCGSYYRLPIF